MIKCIINCVEKLIFRSELNGQLMNLIFAGPQTETKIIASLETLSACAFKLSMTCWPVQLTLSMFSSLSSADLSIWITNQMSLKTTKSINRQLKRTRY